MRMFRRFAVPSRVAMADVVTGDLAHAATVLVTSVLHVREADRFVIIGDGDSVPIVDAIGEAAEAAGAEVTVALLDQLRSVATGASGDRPHKVLPDALRRALLGTQCSAFVASAPHAESSMRDQLLHIVGACSVRHAHMPQISRRAFTRGLVLDYQKIETWGRAMERRLELARTIVAESAAGTNLTLQFSAENHWTAHLGVIGPGQWALLPTGALYAAPTTVDGVFVANASVGEFFGAREGLLLERPIRFFIESGHVVKVEAPHAPAFEAEVKSMLAVAPNSDRVGLAVIGVNVGVDAPSGEAVVDQTMPGLHLIFGDPAGKIPVNAHSARTTFVACQSGGRVAIDGSIAIENGKIVSVG